MVTLPKKDNLFDLQDGSEPLDWREFERPRRAFYVKPKGPLCLPKKQKENSNLLSKIWNLLSSKKRNKEVDVGF